MSEKKDLVVLFPGIRYSVDCPLLYYAGVKYEKMGYEKVCITGYGIDDTKYSLEEYAELATESVKEQLQGIDFTAYGNVVFVSKSMGTVLAPWAEDYFQIPGVTHVLLTPINATFPFLTPKRKVKFITSGTRDSKVDLDKLRKICKKNNFPLRIIKNVGHRLETRKNVKKDIEILRKLVEYM